MRTVEDAKEVLEFIEMDLKDNPDDKAMWVKKGDILRRVRRYDESVAAYDKAHALDQHDFVIIMRRGDAILEKQRGQIAAAEKAGKDVSKGQNHLA